MTDTEFLAAFEACTLPAEAWTHRAHLRMACLYLARLTLGEARVRVREGIQRYNATLNKRLAYHETITQAYLTLIAARMRPVETAADGTITVKLGESFDAFCARNEDLLDSGLGALLVHYRRETLFSPLAQETFVPPDLTGWPKGADWSAGGATRA